MDSSNSRDTSTRGRPSKVARLLDEYDLMGVGVELEQRWTADENRWSLRDLAAYFNQQLILKTLQEEGYQVLDGEIEIIYRLLNDDVASADRMRVQRRLEQNGIDADSIKKDFVSYQAVRTYLHKHRDAEYSPKETDSVKREATNVEKLRGRVISVTEGKVDQLRDSDELDIGPFQTLVDVKIVCENCGGQFEFNKLLERGSCNCQQ